MKKIGWTDAIYILRLHLKNTEKKNLYFYIKVITGFTQIDKPNQSGSYQFFNEISLNNEKSLEYRRISSSKVSTQYH